MNFLNIINTIILAIGVPTILGAFIYIGKKLQVLDHLVVSVENLKHNVQAISNYLIRNHRDFDPSILKMMSPYQIQQGGYDILEKSKFIEIFKNNKNAFFDCVDKNSPKTKLDIENYSIACYSMLFDKDFMTPLKTYLYNNPDNRDVFPVLAGVYIRDAYFAEHPEVKD